MRKKSTKFTATVLFIIIAIIVLLFAIGFYLEKSDEKHNEKVILGVQQTIISDNVTLIEAIHAFFGNDGSWFLVGCSEDGNELVDLKVNNGQHYLSARFEWLGKDSIGGNCAQTITFLYDYSEVTAQEYNQILDKMVQAAKNKGQQKGYSNISSNYTSNNNSSVCQGCNGTGRSDLKCSYCSGTGVDPTYETVRKNPVLRPFMSEECPSCEGTGYRSCPLCVGTERQ